MRKKTFYQSNILWQLFCFTILTIFIICFIVGVQFIVGFINNGLDSDFITTFVSICLIILFFTAVLLMLKLFIRLEHNNIHLDNKKIFMKSDWNNKNNKIQYYSKVYFDDIRTIDIIWTNKNSKGKTIKSRLISALIEKPYLSIKNKKGDTINFFIMYVSKKDVVKLIDEIKKRMDNVGNETEMIQVEEIMKKLIKKK